MAGPTLASALGAASGADLAALGAMNWVPWAVLACGAAVGLFFCLRFAQAQLFAALAEDQIAILDEYRAQGVVPGNAGADYATLTHLLGAISPAVALQPEPWVTLYYGVIRTLGFLQFQRWAERQMTLLAAHQAKRYQSAVLLLAELRADA